MQTACFFRPSQKYFDNALLKAAAQNRPYADAAATPSGVKLSAIDDRLALTLVEDWAVRFRRQYGYVGEIKLLQACVADLFLFEISDFRLHSVRLMTNAPPMHRLFSR